MAANVISLFFVVKAISFIFKNYGWRKFAIITSNTFGVNMVLSQAFDYFIKIKTLDAVKTAEYQLTEADMSDATKLDGMIDDVKAKARGECCTCHNHIPTQSLCWQWASASATGVRWPCCSR